jgi:hypothetical protein
METMTPERLQEIKGLLDFAAEEGVAAIEVTLLNETVMEIDRLTQELRNQTERANDGWNQFNIVNRALAASDSARARYIEIAHAGNLAIQELEAENAQLRRDIDRLRTGLSESLQLQRHYATLLNTWDGGQRITFDSVDKWLERLDTIRKEPHP